VKSVEDYIKYLFVEVNNDEMLPTELLRGQHWGEAQLLTNYISNIELSPLPKTQHSGTET
jgi:hypothetical protein